MPAAGLKRLLTKPRSRPWLDGIQSASNRSMFVKVNPVPSTLADRRAVLRALQNFGEIEVFKRLQTASSFISVAPRPSIVDEIVKNSPLHCESSGAAIFEGVDLGITPTLRSARRSPSLSPEADDESGFAAWHESPRKKSFKISVFPTTEYSHKDNIKLSPLNGPWPEDASANLSFVAASLKAVLPPGIAAKGLRDWQTAGQLVEEPLPVGKHEWVQKRWAKRQAKLASSTPPDIEERSDEKPKRKRLTSYQRRERQRQRQSIAEANPQEDHSDQTPSGNEHGD